MVYEVPNAKAMMGAVFLQYITYAVFYILDGVNRAEEDEIDGDGVKKPGRSRKLKLFRKN
jgi:hypothetical protein